MTIDRLLVLLLSLSFLLLAPPAAANGLAQPAALLSIALDDPASRDQAPDPASPDDAGPFLVTAAPEAPTPASADDGGADGLSASGSILLTDIVLAAPDTRVADQSWHGRLSPRPWSTGPPQA